MIVRDGLPIDIVEGEGFLNLMKTLEPRIGIPSRKTITKMIDDRFDLLKRHVQTWLRSVEWLSLTSDIWTDTLNTKAYLALTAHFVCDNKMRNIILGVREMVTTHTSANIQNLIEHVLLEWNINKEKVVAFITDNGANMVKAGRDTFGKNKQIFCFAHTLNLVVKDAIEAVPEFQDIIIEVKNIVTYFKQTVKAADKLREVQSSNGEPLKLVQEVKTRWNSTFYMLQRFANLYRYIVGVCADLPDSPQLPSRNKIDIIHECISLLEPIEEVTKEVSAEKHVTISKLIPVTRLMSTVIDRFNTVSQIAKNLQQALQLQFNKRFRQIEDVKLISVATLLDPRFKNIYFNNPTACANAITEINKEINILISNSSLPIPSQVEPPLTSPSDIWSLHSHFVSSRSTPEEITSSGLYLPFKQYLQLPVISRNEDVLTFWLQNRNHYTHLYQLHHKYLCIVGTSVPAERVFSKAGNIITAKRNRLSPKRVEKIIFMSNFTLEEWKKFQS
jgi:hypothetical protein